MIYYALIYFVLFLIIYFLFLTDINFSYFWDMPNVCDICSYG